MARDIGAYLNGRTDACYTTPTAYTPEEAVRYMVLPNPLVPRTHVLILDPAAMPFIQGPLWAAQGRGIQYILPYGFPRDAIVVPGAPTGQWEIEVT